MLFLFPSPILKLLLLHPAPIAPDVGERNNMSRQMPYLGFSELLHAEFNLMMYSAHASKKSKAFSALIPLKNYHTLFRLV